MWFVATSNVVVYGPVLMTAKVGGVINCVPLAMPVISKELIIITDSAFSNITQGYFNIIQGRTSGFQVSS